MARIVDYTAPVKGLQLSDLGFTAQETAARRIGPAYGQAAEDFRRQGKLASELLAEQKLRFPPNNGIAMRLNVNTGGLGGAGLAGGRVPTYGSGDYAASAASRVARNMVNQGPQIISTNDLQPAASPAGIVQRDVLSSPEAGGQMFGQGAGDAPTMQPDMSFRNYENAPPRLQVQQEIWDAAAQGEGAPGYDPTPAPPIDLSPNGGWGAWLGGSLRDAASAAYGYVSGAAAGSEANSDTSGLAPDYTGP